RNGAFPTPKSPTGPKTRGGSQPRCPLFLPPRLWGRVGEGDTSARLPTPVPPTPTLPHKRGANRTAPPGRGVRRPPEHRSTLFPRRRPEQSHAGPGAAGRSVGAGRVRRRGGRAALRRRRPPDGRSVGGGRRPGVRDGCRVLRRGPH